MMVLNIVLPEPPSMNRIYRIANNRMYKSKEAKDYTKLVHAICQQNNITSPIAGDVEIVLYWYRKRTNGDIDNRTKLLYDSLEGFAYVNDSQIAIDHRHKLIDRKNPRVELTISEIDD